MSGTISENYDGYGIALDSSGFINPVTNLGTIDFSISYEGIYAGLPWAITNRGLIAAASPDGHNAGVVIHALGDVTNDPGATIEAGSGVVIFGYPAMLRNGGLIAGGLAEGAWLADGGLVFNATGATLSGAVHAAVVSGAVGTIVNGGTMAAGGDGGAVLAAGGLIASTGVLTALYDAATIGGGVGTVVNEGVISAAARYAVRLSLGGTIQNFGTLLAGADGAVIAGGYGWLVNQGLISVAGGAAVALAQRGTVENFGVVSAASGQDFDLPAGGTIYNFGDVFSAGTAVAADGAAVVENAASMDVDAGPAVSLGAGGTVVNNGEIVSTLGAAISIVGGGTVATAGTSTATGVVEGGSAGIVFSGGAGTVIDAGTIFAGGGSAIVFAPGYANVLEVENDSVVGGTVDGGNTIGAAVQSTLVLGATAAMVPDLPELTAPTYDLGFYASDDGVVTYLLILGDEDEVSTFSGLDTRFENFGLIVNPDTWAFEASDAIPAGVTLDNEGLIGGTGVTLGRDSILINGSGSGAVLGERGVRYDDWGGLIPFLSAGGTVVSAAVYAGTASPSVTIVNDAPIVDGIGAGIGIELLAGGTVSNVSTVQGYGTGISLRGPGTIVNADLPARVGDGVTYAGTTGVIEGAVGIAVSQTGLGVVNTAYVTNAGVILGTAGNAVQLYSDGGVTNEAGGTISGGSGAYGVTIEVPAYFGRYGGGAVARPNVVNYPGATIEAGSGVGIFDGTGTIRNGGLIAGSAYDGAWIADAGTIFNAVGATLTGAVHAAADGGGTIINGGLMTAAGNGGALLWSGGRIINGGTLAAASDAAEVLDGLGTVVNEGVLTAAAGADVYLLDGGAVGNFDTLASGDVGVSAGGGPAQIVNEGWLVGGSGPAVLLSDQGQVINGNVIRSTLGPAISIVGGGTVANGGLISGATGGIVFRGLAGTVIDNGAIMAGSGSPIRFTPGYANVLTVSSYATFSGPVDGANTIGAAVASTLFLADLSTYAFTRTAPSYDFGFYGYSGGVFTNHPYVGPPTFSGLASEFTDFATIVNEAAFVFDGSDAIGAGVTLLNDGTIEGSGVTLGRGGELVNGAPDGKLAVGGVAYRQPFYYTRSPEGPTAAVYAGSASGSVTIVNELPITDHYTQGIGVQLLAGGTVSNASTISGGAVGITVAGLATIDNAGTIAGGGAAVLLGAGYADRVIARPGAVFGGLVDGGNAHGSSVVSTLELAPGVGTLAGLGSRYTDFGAVAVDAGATWTLAGGGTLAAGVTADVAGTLVLGGALAGTGVVGLLADGEVAFTPGDAPSGIVIGGDGTIEVIGAAETIAGYGGGRLTLAGDAAITLDVMGSYHFSASQVGGNSYVTACFAGGTAILTDAGPRAVEALRAGMRVVTASGRLAPVAWIGRRRLALARHPRPWDVMPVRVRAGAFGRDAPARDLVLSPDHAVLACGVLIPVRYLINGDTIAQETRAAVTYWHVELDRHDVVLAEGLACESYLDTGNREAFEGGGAMALHPVFASGEGCLPLVLDTGDARMVAARAALLARAGRVTDEAEMRLLAGGKMLHPRYECGRVVFDLPGACEAGTLVSLAHVPAQVRAESDDHRVLGVAVAGIWLDGRRLSRLALEKGWQAAEAGHRWTDGAGVIPLGGARRLVLRMGPPGRYRVGAGGLTARAAGRTPRPPGPAAAAATAP